MNPSSLHVLVYGATGSQASPVVRHLLARGHQPFVFTRHPEKAAALQAAGATVVVGDMADAAHVHAASQGMDAVALLVPFSAPNPLALGCQAVDAARAAGVKLLVWNTSGAFPPARTGNPEYDVRFDLRDYLQASQVPHITLVPTVYAENLLGPWTAPGLAAHHELAYPIPAKVPVNWLAADDLGALTAALVSRSDLAGRTFAVAGPELLTGPELAARFTAGLGRAITYRAMPPAEFAAILAPLAGPEAAEAVAAGYGRLWENPAHSDYLRGDVAPLLAQVPHQMHSLSDWAARHTLAFAPAPE